MINIIAGIVGVAIVVGTVATVLDKRINALQSEIHRNERCAETQLMSMQSEIDKVAADLEKAKAKADYTNSELAYVIDKIEAIDRELRGEVYGIDIWGRGFFGGFKKDGKVIVVGYEDAMIMTKREAERINMMLGNGTVVNRSKTILRNLEDK